MKRIYETAGGTYQRQGDYELPNLRLPSEKEFEIGIWGQRYRRYLKQNHRIRYYNLLTTGTLNEHLAEIDRQAESTFQSTGTVSSMNGEYYAHLHMSAVDGSGAVFGGHLNRAVISATCEMVIDIIDGSVDRRFDEETGLNLFEF